MMASKLFRKGCRTRLVAARPNEIDETGNYTGTRRLQSTKSAKSNSRQLA